MNLIAEAIAGRSRFSALTDALVQLLIPTDALCHGNRTDQLIRDARELSTRRELAEILSDTNTSTPSGKDF